MDELASMKGKSMEGEMRVLVARLNTLVEKKGFNLQDPEVVELSQMIDKLVAKQMRENLHLLRVRNSMSVKG